jgi:nucleoside-diphosphate-sugar epimerase
MKILVTGANGFTGKNFINLVTQTKYDAISLQSNITDYSSLKNEIKKIKPDYILHLAAISNLVHEKVLDYYNINLLGTENLLNALIESGHEIKKIIITSSAGVYGNTSTHKIKEDSQLNPINHYSISKLNIELMAKNYYSKLPIIVTRPFNYTGPGQSSDFLVPKLINNAIFQNNNGIVNIKLGNLDVEREFNDVDNVCKYYLLLMEYGCIHETYNICSGLAYKITDVIDAIENLLNVKFKVMIDQRLIRANEIMRLCGDPSKLNNFLGKSKFSFENEKLELVLQKIISSIGI